MTLEDLPYSQRSEIIHAFHRILQARDQLTALSVPSAVARDGGSVASPFNGVTELMTLSLNLVATDFFLPAVQNELVSRMNTDVDFRVFMLNTSTAFRGYLKTVHGISAIDIARSVFEPYVTENAAITHGRLEAALYQGYAVAKKDETVILTSLANCDFWMTCILLFIQTYHLNDQHNAVVAGLATAPGGKVKK